MVQVLKEEWGDIIYTATKCTLVPPATFNELHEGTHVSFAAVAADGAALPMVYNIKRCLVWWHSSKGLDDSCQGDAGLLGHVRGEREAVGAAAQVPGAGVALVLDHAVGGDKGRNLSSCVCGIDLPSPGSLIIFNYLNWAWNRVRIKLLLWWA